MRVLAASSSRESEDQAVSVRVNLVIFERDL